MEKGSYRVGPKKTAYESLRNLREKESMYFEMYDYMRQLELDQVEYKKILKQKSP